MSPPPPPSDNPPTPKPAGARPSPPLVARHRATLRARLLQLVAAIALPLVLLSIIATWHAYSTDRARQLERLLQRAQSVASTVDLEFETGLTELQVLATSRSLALGDIDRFGEAMHRTSAVLNGATINLIAPDGVVAMSTNWPPGERRANVQTSDFARDALRRNQPAVSDLVLGPSTGKAHVGVALPVPSATPGQPAWLLTLYLPANALQRSLARLNLPPGWLASVADRQNRIVARSRNQAAFIGKSTPPDMLEAISHASTGLVGDHQTIDGVASLAAFAHAPLTGYSIGLAMPTAEFADPLRATVLRALTVGLLLVAVGVGAALLLARRLVGALQSVAAAPPGAARHTGVREIDDLADALCAAETRRRETADRFRLLAETMPGWVFMSDAEGRNTYVNSTYAEQTGRPPADLMQEGWMAIIHPDDRARAVAELHNNRQSGREIQVEYRCRMHDGAYRWFLVRARPLRNEQGALVSWCGVAVDIHDRLEAERIQHNNEAALRALNQDLEARVQSEIAAREAAQVRAAHAERMQALGQLAGGIAHDFNNVLQGVLGGAALIERRTDDPQQVANLSRMIRDTAHRGALITRRLLAFSRRDTLQPEAVEPAALLEGMQDLLLHTIGDGIQVVVQAPLGLPALLADKGSLETVLINLATNAHDAMSGTGRLTLSASADRVTATGAPERPITLPTGDYIRLSVTDVGAGMDRATLARASEPFFTTKPMGKGTGLGLAMARGFAEQSGGGLQITSTLGQGTTIHLWLPQAPRSPAVVHHPDSSPVPHQTHARLLLVDDDAVVRQTLAQQMEDAGFIVLPAASAAYALALLDAGEPIDLVITDLSMPGMNGATLIREVHKRRPGLKAILVTGFANQAADIPADPDTSLLHKPIAGTFLARYIMSLLSAEAVET